VVSNAAPDMLDAALENAGLTEQLDMVLSVEEVREYKPSRRVYQLAQSWLELDASEVAYCSTNPWDIAGAASFGFKVVWVNRFGLRPENLHTEINAEIKSLSELPALLGV
jgi:2-haloacid dehalogenase